MGSQRIQQQKFYIVAHNPNTKDDAEAYLKAGANALEPDVCFSSKPSRPDHYYVSHSHTSSDPDSHDFDHEHSLANYMQGIKDLILRNNYNLAFIWFDYKDSPEGDINTLLKIVHDNFTVFDQKCADVAIMVSVAHISDCTFVNGYDQSIPNAGVAMTRMMMPLEYATISSPPWKHASATPTESWLPAPRLVSTSP